MCSVSLWYTSHETVDHQSSVTPPMNHSMIPNNTGGRYKLLCIILWYSRSAPPIECDTPYDTPATPEPQIAEGVFCPVPQYNAMHCGTNATKLYVFLCNVYCHNAIQHWLIQNITMLQKWIYIAIYWRCAGVHYIALEKEEYRSDWWLNEGVPDVTRGLRLS